MAEQEGHISIPFTHTCDQFTTFFYDGRVYLSDTSYPIGQCCVNIVNMDEEVLDEIDRVRLGYVVDMLDTMFMDFPVFNVADVFVVCGTVCALIYYLAFYSKSDEKNWGNKVDGTDPAANK